MNAVICVFCENIVAEKTDYSKSQYCLDCNDYKGLTTVRDFMEVYA